MIRNRFFLLLLFLALTKLSVAQQIIELETNYNHHIRNVKIPHDVVCKFKNYSDKMRGSFYELKNDTLNFREYYTNDTFKICWSDVTWMRIKRNAFVSIIYDGWMIGSWVLTAVGIESGLFANTLPQGSEGAGYLLAAGVGIVILTLPQAIFSTVHRFKKYNPHDYKIRSKMKLISKNELH